MLTPETQSDERPNPPRFEDARLFQPMPDLSPEQYSSLRSDIEEHGVLVPVVVDQHDRVLDGHNRLAIATDLGIECPREVRHVTDDNEAGDLAVTLNCARRHLNREQIRILIGDEIHRRPGDSDRAIARRVGCDHKTVAAVRRGPTDQGGEIPQVSREEAEERTAEIREHLKVAREHVAALICIALSNNISEAEVVAALTMAQRNHEQRQASEIADVFRAAVFNPLIDYVLDPATAGYFRPQWDHETFLPLPDADRAELLDTIAELGIGAAK